MSAIRQPSPQNPWPAASVFLFLIAAVASWLGLAHSLGVLS